MAATYKILGTRPGTAFLGGTLTQAVVIGECQSLPNQVYFEVNVPQLNYQASLIRAAALGYADIFETILTLNNVGGVFWSQGEGKNGELQDMANILVTSASGNSAAYLSPIAITDLGPQLHQSEIDALSTELTDTENS